MILHKRTVLDILAPPLKIYECSIMLHSWSDPVYKNTETSETLREAKSFPMYREHFMYFMTEIFLIVTLRTTNF